MATATTKSKTATASVTVRLPIELKDGLTAQANRKGMDVTKLARVILTNHLKPGTFEL